MRHLYFAKTLRKRDAVIRHALVINLGDRNPFGAVVYSLSSSLPVAINSALTVSAIVLGTSTG